MRRSNPAHLGQSCPKAEQQHMTPHHKPKNVTLTKISRLRVPHRGMRFVPDTAADLSTKGQHSGFEVSHAALVRIRGGFV
jgi:hypothetical protein